jgi:hypothetical protein
MMENQEQEPTTFKAFARHVADLQVRRKNLPLPDFLQNGTTQGAFPRPCLTGVFLYDQKIPRDGLMFVVHCVAVKDASKPISVR